MKRHRNVLPFTAILLMLVVHVAHAELFLNEAVIRGTERVEVYNSDPAPVDLSDWILRGSLGDFIIPGGTIIGPGQYLVFDDLGGIFDDIGGEIDFIDDLKLSRDRVDYGQLGGAPLPHDEAPISLCRAPDASADPPLDPANDAVFWTLDFSSTFGQANDAPAPDLGSSVVINELGTTSLGVRLVNDSVELFNPTAGPIVLVGWRLTFGAGPTHVIGATTLPPGAVIVEKLSAVIELDTTQLAYLFDDSGVRLDQVGWSGSALRGGHASRGEESCLGRCPDGAGVSDGYDAETSGVGETLFVLDCSLGALNGDASECAATPVFEESWGGIKRLYR